MNHLFLVKSVGRVNESSWEVDFFWIGLGDKVTGRIYESRLWIVITICVLWVKLVNRVCGSSSRVNFLGWFYGSSFCTKVSGHHYQSYFTGRMRWPSLQVYLTDWFFELTLYFFIYGSSLQVTVTTRVYELSFISSIF